jgi:ABC-type glycerol-3-phosphate transport system substrate-binding protein
MLSDPAYLANERIKKWRPWHDVMLSALQQKRLLPLGFTRPEDNLLPFLAELDGSSIVADMVVAVMDGQKPPKAEADRAQKRAEELLTQLGHKRWA